MNRRIVLVLAIIAGVALALILLLPSGSGDEDERAAVGRTTVEKHDKVVRTQRTTVDEELPPAKKEAADARTARRSTPYFQHVQTVAKRWMRVGNLMAAQGKEEDATKARTVARALRSASRPDGTEEAQKAALDEEAKVLQEMQAKYTEGDVSKILANVAQAYDAVLAGEAPPAMGKAVGQSEGAGGIAPSEDAGEAGAGAP